MMKKLLTVLMTIAMVTGAMAEVPSLINYQGRLKEKNGTNVNGTKNFTVRIFDAKEGGKQTYEENVGAVVIKEGAYSFGFGEAGESILDFSESLFVQEDGKQIFDFTLSRTPVAESLSIEAREFKWNEKTGSSHVNDLLVQYDKNNKSTKVILLQSSMEKGSALKFDYGVQESGIMTGLASSQYNWLEITVDSETLSPRERLVTVPFALEAKMLSEYPKFGEYITIPKNEDFLIEQDGFVIVSGSAGGSLITHYDGTQTSSFTLGRGRDSRPHTMTIPVRKNSVVKTRSTFGVSNFPQAYFMPIIIPNLTK